jgi:hypothetical protein
MVSLDICEVVCTLDRKWCDHDGGVVTVEVDLEIALCIVGGLKSLVKEIKRRRVRRVMLFLKENGPFL